MISTRLRYWVLRAGRLRVVGRAVCIQPVEFYRRTGARRVLTPPQVVDVVVSTSGSPANAYALISTTGIVPLLLWIPDVAFKDYFEMLP